MQVLRFLFLALIVAALPGADVGLGPMPPAAGVSGQAISPSSVTDSGLTSGRVTTAGTGGLLQDSASLQWNGTAFSVGGTALATYAHTTANPSLQLLGTSANSSTIGVARFASSSNSPSTLSLARSAGTTVGDYTAVAAGNSIAFIRAYGSDGTDLNEAGSISWVVDTGATVSTGIVPGRFRLGTSDSTGAATQSFAVDSTQVIQLGPSTIASSGVFGGGTIRPKLQESDATGNSNGIALIQWRAATTGPTLYLGKSRSSTIGTMTVATTGDTAGTISFEPSDGTNFNPCAQIVGTVTGTVGSTQTPGSLILKTGTNASPSVMTAAVTVDNAQGLTTAAARYIHKRAVVSAAGTTTLDASDYFVVITGSTTQTVTLPAAVDGRVLIIKDRSTGTVTYNRAGSDTIDGGTSGTVTTGNHVMLIANATDWTIN